MRCWAAIWLGAKFWLVIVGEGVWVKAGCGWKPNWGCCEGVCERDRVMVAPAESRFWGIDDMGYGRAPFIGGFAMALGSMKLEGSYMAFCGDWKSMAEGVRGGVDGLSS